MHAVLVAQSCRSLRKVHIDVKKIQQTLTSRLFPQSMCGRQPIAIFYVQFVWIFQKDSVDPHQSSVPSEYMCGRQPNCTLGSLSHPHTCRLPNVTLPKIEVEICNPELASFLIDADDRLPKLPSAFRLGYAWKPCGVAVAPCYPSWSIFGYLNSSASWPAIYMSSQDADGNLPFTLPLFARLGPSFSCCIVSPAETLGHSCFSRHLLLLLHRRCHSGVFMASRISHDWFTNSPDGHRRSSGP